MTYGGNCSNTSRCRKPTPRDVHQQIHALRIRCAKMQQLTDEIDDYVICLNTRLSDLVQARDMNLPLNAKARATTQAKIQSIQATITRMTATVVSSRATLLEAANHVANAFTRYM